MNIGLLRDKEKRKANGGTHKDFSSRSRTKGTSMCGVQRMSSPSLYKDSYPECRRIACPWLDREIRSETVLPVSTVAMILAARVVKRSRYSFT